MAESIRNRRSPGSLSEADVDAAVARLEIVDVALGRDARHIYEVLTWGEGPGMLSQSGVQDWLWYRLPTKYLTDEAGYMGRLAGVAARLFDELGLDAYAAICRSDVTAGVHAAFDRSRRSGYAALRKANESSGIAPPDLEDFAWGGVMGVEEAMAHSAVEAALEAAIADGRLVVGGKRWRSMQREVAAAALDAEHPDQPGQTRRTAVLTERVGRWVDETRTSPILARLRADVANELLHPVAPPTDVAERLAPVTWLLQEFGEEQTLTQSGYLNTAFVRRVHETQPWEDPFAPDEPPRTETDAMTLHRLRNLLQAIGALRKQRQRLVRTARGEAMATDPTAIWQAFTRSVPSNRWDRFAVAAAGTVLVGRGEAMPADDVQSIVAQVAAETGWRTSRHGSGGPVVPSQHDVGWAVADTFDLLELFGMLVETGDWRKTTWLLTPDGRATLLALLRAHATGPRQRP